MAKPPEGQSLLIGYVIKRVLKPRAIAAYKGRNCPDYFYPDHDYWAPEELRVGWRSQAEAEAELTAFRKEAELNDQLATFDKWDYHVVRVVATEEVLLKTS